MAAKNELSHLEKIRNLIKNLNGPFLTSDLEKAGIPRIYLTILERNGEIERVSRGIYRKPASIDDPLFNFQARYKSVIFSHETAVSLHDLTDRTPSVYSVSVPIGYHSISLNRSGHHIYYVNRSLFDIGLVMIKDSYGNDIRATNLERTICDIFRSRNQLGSQFVSNVLKKYEIHKGRNINRLYDYTKQFQIQKVFREYIETIL